MILRRVIAHFKKQEWTAIGLDFVIVVAGVYLGIYLGNVRDAQKYAAETRQSLQALEAEMRSDLPRLDEIIAFQTEKAEDYHRLIEALGEDHPDGAELKSLIETTNKGNDTFFPSKSAYEAMKTAGYLASLPDAELRSALTRLFERDYVRQHYNADYYDQVGYDVYNLITAQCWDRFGGKLLSCGEDSAAVLRNGVSTISDQGDYYLSLLTGIVRPEIVESLAKIDAFQEAKK